MTADRAQAGYEAALETAGMLPIPDARVLAKEILRIIANSRTAPNVLDTIARLCRDELASA